MSENNLRRILVVDDEPHILSAVRRELHAPPHDLYKYAVEGFSDPALALQRAREVSFDAVISDFRMPGMDGVAFLRALAALQPDCARLVLSGQTDMGALVRMVNENHVYRFIPKPWSAYYLKASLGQALDYSALLLEHRRLADLTAVRGAAPVAAAAAARSVERVLVVDDDAAALNAMAQALRALADDDELARAIRAEAAHRGDAPADIPTAATIEVTVERSPLRALDLAKDTDFACIVADQRTSGMDGVDLLKRFALLQPDCARILLGGGIAQGELIHAVNAVHIFAFIEKPWSDFEMRKTLLLALSRRRMLRENRRLAHLVGKRAVPPAPTFDDSDPADTIESI